MIDPTHLRIGNLVHETSSFTPDDGSKTLFEVAIINSRYSTVTDSNDTISQPEYLFGIPLTPEWLERMGFKKEDKTPSINHGQYFSIWVMDYKYSFAYAPFREDWGFYHSYTDAPKDEDNNRFDFISCGIKYVHQLQNLYFALTSQELTIKP